LIGSGSYAGGWPAFEASNSVGMNCLPGIRTSGVDSVASFLATSGFNWFHSTKQIGTAAVG
jgi:hypothetical protein